MNIEETNFFANVPPEGRRGPKKGTSGRKSKIFTDDKISELLANPNKWIILLEGADTNTNSNAISWTRRHPGFKTTCRKMSSNPADKPLTIFAIYRPEKEDN